MAGELVTPRIVDDDQHTAVTYEFPDGDRLTMLNYYDNEYYHSEVYRDQDGKYVFYPEPARSDFFSRRAEVGMRLLPTIGQHSPEALDAVCDAMDIDR